MLQKVRVNSRNQPDVQQEMNTLLEFRNFTGLSLSTDAQDALQVTPTGKEHSIHEAHVSSQVDAHAQSSRRLGLPLPKHSKK